MYSLTQGTIITGVRSDKYSNIRCNGVVISARCDLANCKISKIYYLIAVPSDDWLLSDEGFNIVLSQRQNDLEDELQTKLGGSGLDWSTLKSFSVEEFSTVPYDIAASGFTQQEEAVCDIPRLYMYSNEEEMIESLKGHVDRFKQETQCKNYDIALISFEDTLLIPQNVEKLSSLLGKKMYVLKNRQTSSLSRSIKTDDPIILSDPYNVNGLEFKCVILFGVDEGRLPQNTGVSDISANYIKYIAFNQLYLASSRAKYRLILIGNSLHGVSSCLQYALESGKLETGDQV